MSLPVLLTRTAIAGVVALVVLGFVTGGGLGVAGAQAEDGPTPISSCTTITEPGQYVLTQDIAADASTDACLVIDLEGTVVIGGEGHSIVGGIDADPHSAEDVRVTLELSDTTVDFIRYPAGDFTGGGGASGLLENVTVGSIEVVNIDGLTIESSLVENDIEGSFAGDVTLRNSTFEGRLDFAEDTVDFEVVNNTFAEEVVFHEHLLNSYIADNTFRSSLHILDAGLTSENVVIENNRFSVAADQADGLEEGAIVFTDGADNAVRNNVIAVERDEGTDTTDANGIFIAGEENVIRANRVSGADYGIHVFSSADGRIVDNTLTDNRVGIRLDRSSDRVTANDITDNDVGVEVVSENARSTLERNVIANNSEFGVQNLAGGGFVFDARNNYWGAADGPSSAPADDADAPFADPETGALANGSGDAVSEGGTDGVSNVRFDPFLAAAPNETADSERFYQVDFVDGDVIETFGPADSDRFYSDQGRLIRFLHGSTSQPVERVSTPPTLAENLSSCIDIESFEVSGDTATIRYTVEEGCPVDVALVSYEKPGPGWSRPTASEQRLVDVDRAPSSEPGTYELSVAIPTNAPTTETQSIG